MQTPVPNTIFHHKTLDRSDPSQQGKKISDKINIKENTKMSLLIAYVIIYLVEKRKSTEKLSDQNRGTNISNKFNK